MRRPDELILIAVWEFVTAIGMLIGISAIFIFAFPEVNDLWGLERIAGMFGLSVGVMILFISACLAITGGIGLLTGKEWGRVLSLIYATLSLLRIPFGTIIGILVIVYLVKPKVKEYFITARK
jgi:hypothetical protein